MIVPYTEINEQAGGTPRPLLDIDVGSMGEFTVPALVDSGAINTILPRWAAAAAGIDVTGPSIALRVGGSEVGVRFEVVSMTAGGLTWEAEVGFCESWPYAWGLLGHHAFFRFFEVRFRAADFEFEVEPIAG